MDEKNEKMFLDKYNKGIEKNRLHKGLGLIEFARTKEILLEMLPTAPAVIYDIGGAYGEYSFWLASLGYEVYLYDLSEKNIKMAHKFGRKCGAQLHCAEVADARKIPRSDESADAILLFGPLYHLTEREEREKCLAECKRLLKPGGLLFTANINAYASVLHFVSVYDKQMHPSLDSDAAFAGLERTVKTGVHIGGGLGLGFFHKPEELRAELENAGFRDVDIRGVIGPCWLIRNLDRAWKNKKKRENILRVVRLLEKEESLMGLSTHFLSISKK
ncbi:MAG: methyltransferase domain-containing protein [Oscillospiraceae bacterium]|nr:methyltransferase domain-containing protein [Oscillospiraceae bacterium]